MRTIAILVMKRMLAKAKKQRLILDNPILEKAYDQMIKSYEDAFLFLEANKY